MYQTPDWGYIHILQKVRFFHHWTLFTGSYRRSIYLISTVRIYIYESITIIVIGTLVAIRNLVTFIVETFVLVWPVVIDISFVSQLTRLHRSVHGKPCDLQTQPLVMQPYFLHPHDIRLALVQEVTTSIGFPGALLLNATHIHPDLEW